MVNMWWYFWHIPPESRNCCFMISWARGCSYTFVQKGTTWTCLIVFWMTHACYLFQHFYIGLHSHQEHFTIAARLKKGSFSSTVQAASELVHRRIKDTILNTAQTGTDLSVCFIDIPRQGECSGPNLPQFKGSISCHTYRRLLRAICRHY